MANEPVICSVIYLIGRVCFEDGLLHVSSDLYQETCEPEAVSQVVPATQGWIAPLCVQDEGWQQREPHPHSLDQSQISCYFDKCIAMQ